MRQFIFLIFLLLIFCRADAANSPIIYGQVAGVRCAYNLIARACVPTTSAITETSTFWHTYAGYGSGNTKIPYFTTEVGTVGTDFTVSNDSTLGFSITIVTAGVYSFTYCHGADNGNEYVALSKNSNQLTTGSATINAAHRVAGSNPAAANYVNCVTYVAWLVANDVIRPHTEGVAFALPARDNFTAARIY